MTPQGGDARRRPLPYSSNKHTGSPPLHLQNGLECRMKSL